MGLLTGCHYYPSFSLSSSSSLSLLPTENGAFLCCPGWPPTRDPLAPASKVMGLYVSPGLAPACYLCFASLVLAFLEAHCDIHILFPTLQIRKQELMRLKNLTLLNLVEHTIILVHGSLRQEDPKLEVNMGYIKTKQIQLRQQMTSVPD